MVCLNTEILQDVIVQVDVVDVKVPTIVQTSLFVSHLWLNSLVQPLSEVGLAVMIGFISVNFERLRDERQN